MRAVGDLLEPALDCVPLNRRRLRYKIRGPAVFALEERHGTGMAEWVLHLLEHHMRDTTETTVTKHTVT